MGEPTSYETWYRGEGVGVAPSKPGGNLHDLGDGLYLSDKEDVALQYAKVRAPGEKSFQLLEVTVERASLGRVLDLTTDSRWAKFMTQPMVPGSANPQLSKSGLDFLRIKYELYGQFFEELLGANKIDIKTYDAVVGPEYVRGGKQLCILLKNGLPTPLTARIRSLFRPRSAAGVLTVKPVPSGLARAIGGLLVNAAISVLISYVAQKIMQHINDDIIRQRMEEFRSELDKIAAATRVDIVDRLARGEGAYVSAYIEVDFDMIPNQDWQNPGYLASPALVHLESFTISSQDMSSTPVKHTKDTPGILSGGTWQDLYYFWVSGKPPVDKEEVERYRAFLEQLKWCEDTIKDPNIKESDRLQIETERLKLKQWLKETYPSTDFKPNKSLWTEDGYSNLISSGWGRPGLTCLCAVCGAERPHVALRQGDVPVVPSS
jgi:hypothetical protein